MLFSTKGRTLLKLRSKGFNIPDLILIKNNKFIKYPDKVVDQICNRFNQLVAIRSSAANEDSDEDLGRKISKFFKH